MRVKERGVGAYKDMEQRSKVEEEIIESFSRWKRKVVDDGYFRIQ